MALAYDATRVTRDVDSLFVPHGVVLEEARNVAQELGLPPWWLNEQASVYISGKDDPGKRRVFDHPGLRVTAASPRHIFAMKALAARTRDIDDLRLLAEMIGVDSAATAVQICAEFFPEEDIPARSAAVLKSSSADLRTLEPYPAGRPVQEQADAGQRCPGLIPPLHRGSLMPGVPPVFQPGSRRWWRFRVALRLAVVGRRGLAVRDEPVARPGCPGTGHRGRNREGSGVRWRLWPGCRGNGSRTGRGCAGDC